MEKGKDLRELCRKSGNDTSTFEYDDKSWEVHYRKVDWRLRFNAIEDAWKAVKTVGVNGDPVGDLRFDTAQYYEQVLMAALVDINGQKVDLPLLRSFDAPVITHLIQVVPGPSLLTDLADSKKEFKPSIEES